MLQCNNIMKPAMKKGTMHLGYFIKVEFWHGLIALYVLNPMVQVSLNNIDHKWSYDHFMQ